MLRQLLPSLIFTSGRLMSSDCRGVGRLLGTIRRPAPSRTSHGHGADVLLDFVGAEATIELARTAARTLGDATIVGIAGGTVPLSFFSQPYEVGIQTTYWGSRPELAELLDLAARGLVHVESITYSLDDAAQAYRDLQDGKVHGHAVVVP